MFYLCDSDIIFGESLIDVVKPSGLDFVFSVVSLLDDSFTSQYPYKVGQLC